ncbi:hypothetical protein C4573_00615 [Candidatus Woesearchaeota archaeon]|nr:MAG: hypothetical protein C4573_00615 [Candidatus Woesearchaeota archaeon]
MTIKNFEAKTPWCNTFGGLMIYPPTEFSAQIEGTETIADLVNAIVSAIEYKVPSELRDKLNRRVTKDVYINVPYVTSLVDEHAGIGAFSTHQTNGGIDSRGQRSARYLSTVYAFKREGNAVRGTRLQYEEQNTEYDYCLDSIENNVLKYRRVEKNGEHTFTHDLTTL